MGIVYLVLAISFAILFVINITWAIVNLYFFGIEGIQTLLKGTTFVENVYYSTYLKWILFWDALWIISLFGFMYHRKHYKSDPKTHYLKYDLITEPKICVTMHAYNEELAIKKTVEDFINQKFVNQVIVIDNHSTDRTVETAKLCGAKVITKESNKGYAHSWYVGLCEALKTDANIIVITDADGTYNGYDISKMLPYLDNCDMVIGSRMTQVLTEDKNQNTAFLVWGNIFIAKLLQIKYFSLRHLGVAQLTDVGCSYRCIRREALEKIIHDFTKPQTNEFVKGINDVTIALFTTAKAIENDLRIVEIPVTFNKRIGISKSGVSQKKKALQYGLQFIWFILRS